MLFLASCGTIITGSEQSIPISSDPSEAAVKITDASGNLVKTDTTPCTVDLKKGAGYFKKAEYTVVVEKSGYEPMEFQLTGDVNMWYIAGNLGFGGLIGWLVVDPLTGGMWMLSPEEIKADFAKKESLLFSEEGIHIVLKENVPSELVPFLIPIATGS
jgi:hypothetical protein